MGRNILAWLLIVIGLTGAIGGVGMGYIFTVFQDSAANSARVEEQMDPNHLRSIPGTRARSDLPSPYLAPVVSLLIGGSMTFLGLRLRKTSTKRGR